MKDRQAMIDEMIVQVRGVFNYYTDQKLMPYQLNDVRAALNETIPEQYTTDSWDAYAAMKDEEYKKESEDNDVLPKL